MRGDLAILALIDSGRLLVDWDRGLVFAPRSNTPERAAGARTAKGYLRVCVTLAGRQMHFMAHRIVLVSRNGPVPNGEQIDHLNGDKTDNRLCNLEAVAARENMRRAARDGRTNGGWRDGPRDPQTGQFIGKARAGRLLDGREHNAMPEAHQLAKEARNG